MHCVWECDEIKTFWTEVINPLLWHLYPTYLHLGPKEYKFMDFAILQAKRTIGLNWKRVEAPTVGMWLKNMVQCMTMERITYTQS